MSERTERLRVGVLCLTLDQAEWQWRQGLITDAEWEDYCHAWQTGAARFSVQLCRCAECMAPDRRVDAD